jgi:signal transduction histidine kinase
MMFNDSEEERLIEAGRMAARLIHDFKNQLSGLKLYAAYLKKRFADNPEGLEIAEKINQGLNEMADQAAILNKLMRPLELRREPGDPLRLVEQVIGSYVTGDGNKKVQLECQAESGLPQVSFDPQHIRAALESIVGRAIESSPQGSTVTVSVKCQREALQIEIADQGETLDDQQRHAMFEALGGDRINKSSLGLAMARRIIEKHGGKVAARTNSPAGTIIELRLLIED